jgi:N-acetyl-gamma-glutamyl-phosphate reductase
VAPFFRGITLTASVTLDEPIDAESLERLYRERYDPEPLVRVLGPEIPLVRQISGRHHVEIGGLSVDETEPRHVVMVATLDNLLKGAATQALQNLNLACGFDELEGIRPALG